MINMTLNATFQDGKITIDINDLLSQIKQGQLTEVEYKVEPKPMAFDTQQELDDYVKNNPNATCEGISTEELVKFIHRNKDTYCFLKEADLGDADLEGADLSGDYLVGAYLDGADLSRVDFGGANLRGADLCYTTLYDTKYNDKTIFPEGFAIPETMIKI